MLKPILKIKVSTGRWEYCRDTENGGLKWYHHDCDLVSGDDGCCIGCGKANPDLLEQRRKTIELEKKYGRAKCK